MTTADLIIGQEFRRWAPEAAWDAPGDGALALTLAGLARAAEANLVGRGDTPPATSERPEAVAYTRRNTSPYHLARARARAEEREPIVAPWAA